MTSSNNARIFVQIASYRDPECQWTVKDLFEKATHPERIFVGICWQYDPEEDAHCFEVEPPFPDQVRVFPVHWKESQGVCWARHQTQQLWEGEDYTLVIDSHMRFAQGWDEALIAELAECASSKAVISCHPPGYTPPNTLDPNPKNTIMRPKLFDQYGDIRATGELVDRAPDKPLRGALIAAGFMFSKADIIREVPYDPYLYFNQEEMSLAVRFYTNGWDVYHAKGIHLYHYYNDQMKDKKRPMHWDNNAEWTVLQQRAHKRFLHLLGMTATDDKDALAEIDTFGLGKTRALAEFEAFTGINFQKREVSDYALRAKFIEGLEKVKDRLFIPELDDPKQKAAAAAVVAAAPAVTPLSTMRPLDIPYSIFTDKKLGVDEILMRDGTVRKMNMRRDVPPEIMMITDYLEKDVCDRIMKVVDSLAFTKLNVVDHENSTKDQVITKASEGRITDNVEIDAIASDILTIFNDVYCRRLSPFYNVPFEWYERPQVLRYGPGGKYDQHADADHWLPETKTWTRTQDRDYSVLLYLNEEYGGGELHFPNFDFKFKPTTGMLAAFPSDHRYLHAALPTTSGTRYVIVSWAAILGTPRVRDKAPYASVFVRQQLS